MIYIRDKVYPYSEEGDCMLVSKWGNSLAVRLPAVVVEALDLKEGDDVEIHVLGSREFAIDRKPSIRDRLKKLRKLRKSLPADFRFDRNEANER